MLVVVIGRFDHDLLHTGSRNRVLGPHRCPGAAQLPLAHRRHETVAGIVLLEFLDVAQGGLHHPAPALHGRIGNHREHSHALVDRAHPFAARPALDAVNDLSRQDHSPGAARDEEKLRSKHDSRYPGPIDAAHAVHRGTPPACGVPALGKRRPGRPKQVESHLARNCDEQA